MECHRIALLLEPWPEFRQAIWRGIDRFAQTRPDWQMRVFFPVQSPRAETQERLRAWRPDGLIGAFHDPGWVRFAKRLRVPVVDVAHSFAQTFPARVTSDDHAIGRLAADYLCGLERPALACILARPRLWAQLRVRGFEEQLAARGLVAAKLLPPLTEAACRDWVRRLPRPAALFAGDDHLASLVFRACALENLAVPEDVAILGATNEPVFCEHAPTPLSSIPWPGEEVGEQAAGLLQRLLDGASPPRHPILVAPLPVVERTSTQCFRSPDPLVRASLRALHGRGGLLLSVKEITARLGVSRRQLEHRFRLGWPRSLAAELRDLRLRRARQLLAESGDPIVDVARSSGFGSHANFCVFFRETTGFSPLEYRLAAVKRLSEKNRPSVCRVHE